jgi:hypothetical protein
MLRFPFDFPQEHGWTFMGVVMFKCRTTGREFSTGVYVDEETFKKLPDTVTKAACPHCDRVHAWWTREARVSVE